VEAVGVVAEVLEEPATTTDASFVLLVVNDGDG